MEKLVAKYITVKLAQISYENIYTKPIKRFFIKMIVFLLMEIIIVSITNKFIPKITNIVYAFYNYINLVSYINFIIVLLKINSPILEYMRYALLFRIFFSNIYLDTALVLFIIIFYYPKKKQIYFYTMQFARIIYSNLNRQMKFLLFVYIAILIYSFFL